MMKKLLCLLVSLYLITLSGCLGDGNNPTPSQAGEVTFEYDGLTVRGGATAFRLRDTNLGGDLIMISFGNGDYSLTVQLNESSQDRLEAGKVFPYSNDGNPKPALQLSEWSNGSPDPNRIYQMLEGSITVDAYDEPSQLISVSFGATLLNVSDLSATREISGSISDLTIEE